MSYRVSEELIRRSITDPTIIGKIEYHDNGDRLARTFTGKILGFYRVKYDWTTTFEGMVLNRGDSLISLIYQEDAKTRQF